jgi:phosphoglycerate dehydrogenase-like enzyme
MGVQKSYLVIGRLPTSKLFETIKSKYSITHIPTRGISRGEIISQIHSLPQKSFTCAVILAETQHLAPINKEVFGPLQIECLCKNGAGYDVIDVDYFTSKGTWVANAPNAVRIPTAEWAIALILSTVKGLGIADKHVRTGNWRYELGLRSNLRGMTLGIIGLGAIGKVRTPRSLADCRKSSNE